MDRALELAGFFAAHGIWCVSDGGPLVPMLAHESLANGRSMLRFAAEQLEEGVAGAQRHLESNPHQSDRAAFHRPKFLEWQGEGNPDYSALGKAFFRGVDSHGETTAIWAEHRDDSI